MEPTEPLDRVDVGSLRRWLQVAQAHIVNHTTMQRGYRCLGISHGIVSWLMVGPTTKPSHQEAISGQYQRQSRVSGLVQSLGRFLFDAGCSSSQCPQFSFLVRAVEWPQLGREQNGSFAADGLLPEAYRALVGDYEPAPSRRRSSISTISASRSGRLFRRAESTSVVTLPSRSIKIAGSVPGSKGQSSRW